MSKAEMLLAGCCLIQDLAYGCLKISFGEAVVEESLLLVGIFKLQR